MSDCLTCPESTCTDCEEIYGSYSLVGQSWLNNVEGFGPNCPQGFICGPIGPTPGQPPWNPPPPPPPCPNNDCGNGGKGHGSTLTLQGCQSTIVRSIPAGISVSDYEAILLQMLQERSDQDAACGGGGGGTPTPTAKNDKQCVSCSGGEAMTQTGALPASVFVESDQLCIAANTFSGATKAAANATALTYVTQALADALVAGRVSCSTPVMSCVDAFGYTPPNCPCDLSVPDNTVVGTATPTLPLTNDVTFSFGAASYKITYLSGAISIIESCGFDSNNYDSYYIESDPFGFAAGKGYWAIYVDNSLTPQLLALLQNGGGFGSYGFISNLSGAPGGCSPTSLATFEGTVQADPGQPTFVDHYGGTFKIHYEQVTPAAGGESPPNPSFQITRTAKDCLAPAARLRINATDFTGLTPILVNGNAAAGGAVVWDGTFPEFNRDSLFSNWTWRMDFSGGDPKINGKQLDTQCKVQHNTAGQPTGTGCAWILDVLFAGGELPWVGYGGNGCDPTGQYVFNVGLSGWTPDLQLADVDVATDGPLPANTRTLNVLTASSNGALSLIDGIALVNGDRLLVKDEVTAANNGVYDVTDVGSGGTPWVLTRSPDQDTSLDLVQGVFTRATAGNVGESCYFRMVTDAVVLNTTALEWLTIPALITVESY